MDNPKAKQKAIVVTGSDGRIGRLLRILWGRQLAGHPIVWSARTPSQDIDLPWNIGIDPAPYLTEGAVIVHLAGQTCGTVVELAENRRAVLGLGAVARTSGTGHVFLMSSVAVYGHHSDLIDETAQTNPVSLYGQAKLAAEQAAHTVLPAGTLTILRLGNLAGADALLSSIQRGPVVLDPIPGQAGGPLRSYIGPKVLAQALASLILRALDDKALPDVLNLAQPPALAMADLLQASGADWHFGPCRAQAVPCVAVNTARLFACVDLPVATAQSVVDDLASLQGLWP